MRTLLRGSRLEKARSMRVFSNNREVKTSGLLAQVGLRDGGTPLTMIARLALLTVRWTVNNGTVYCC